MRYRLLVRGKLARAATLTALLALGGSLGGCVGSAAANPSGTSTPASPGPSADASPAPGVAHGDSAPSGSAHAQPGGAAGEVQGIPLAGVVFPGALGDHIALQDADVDRLVAAGFTCLSPTELLKPQELPASALGASGDMTKAAVVSYAADLDTVVAQAGDCATVEPLLLTLAYFQLKDAPTAQSFAQGQRVDGSNELLPGVVCGGASCYTVSGTVVWMLGTNAPSPAAADLTALASLLHTVAG